MKAKFFTKDSLSECYKYSAPQALGAIVLGLVIAVVALVAGITVLFFKSVIGGGLLLVSLMILALIILYYGFFGATNMIKSNTILTNSKTKETIILDDKIIEVTVGEDSSETREFGYQYVSLVKYNKGMFIMYLTDGTSILFSNDKIVEGDIDELRSFLYEKFGKVYIDKAFFKEIDFKQTSALEEQEDTAEDIDNTTNADQESDMK